MIARAALAAAAALALAACIEADRGALTAGEVFQVTVGCANGATCRLAADGRTAIRVSLCLPTDRDRAATVPATVRASGGEWQGADATQPTTATVDLAGTRCPADTLDLAFVPGRTPGLARVETTVGTFVDATDFLLVGAELGEIELRPGATDLSASPTIAIAATVRAAAGGAPSTGTIVRFEIAGATPAGAAAVFPATVEADATGLATTTLQTATGITAVTVRATATAPAIDGDQPAPLARDVELRDVP